jgi:hypothetical protein
VWPVEVVVMSQSERTPRSGIPGVSVVVAAIVFVLLVIGGAFAVGHATAGSTDRSSAATSHSRGYGPDDGPMMAWAQDHRGDVTWMRNHMNDVARMRHHDHWQWMRAHSDQRPWMRVHGNDMARLHDRWERSNSDSNRDRSGDDGFNCR